MISRMLIGSKLLVVGLWLAICFQMVSAGETNTSAVKSNLAVMQEVVKEITREIVDSAHISANDSLIVLFGAGEDVWIVQNSIDRKSTRLNSSHGYISYAVFCLKKK